MDDSFSAIIDEHQLPPRQAAAARMLLRGAQGVKVAEALGVTQQTVSRWRHRPAFRAAMARLQEAANRHAIEQSPRMLRLDGLGRRLGEITARLDEDPPPSANELVALSDQLLEIYKAVSPPLAGG